MAVYKGNGRYSGKVGSVVFCNNREVDYIRSVPDPVKRKPSPKEKINRERFKLANQVMQSLRDVLRIGFHHAPGKGTPLNAAFSDIMKNAITKFPEPIAIDYSRLRIATGFLQAPQNVIAQREGAEISFQWADNSSTGDAAPGDHALLVAISENGSFIFSQNDFTRDQGRGKLLLNERDKIIASWHCYLAFISNRKQEASISMYAGKV